MVWLRTRLLPLQGTGQLPLQGLYEGVGAERPAGTGVATQQFIDGFVVALTDESRPVGDQVQQRSHSNQGIVASREVGCGARPRPILRAGAEARSHRVAFDVPRSRKQVSLIHDERVETLLPKMPFPALAEVDHSSVPAMGFAERVP